MRYVIRIFNSDAYGNSYGIMDELTGHFVDLSYFERPNFSWIPEIEMVCKIFNDDFKKYDKLVKDYCKVDDM